MTTPPPGVAPPGGRPGDLALVGPTATGKTALAFAIARRLGDAELASVDAMAVYRGLDVGTAKPPPDPAVPLHLVDLVDPSEEFSVADFQSACRAVADEVHGRGRRVIYVGGTGLYHRAALGELELPGRFPEVAAALEKEAGEPGGAAHLHDRLAALDPLAASRMLPENRRRVVRALEVTIGSGRPFSSYGPGLERYPAGAVAMVGLFLPRDELDERLRRRLANQLEAGFVEEVRRLAAGGRPLSRTARQAIGYAELLAVVEGNLALDEAVERILRRLRSFARRQEAWFRRDPRVVWLDAGAPDLAEAVLGLLEAAGSPARPCETLAT